MNAPEKVSATPLPPAAKGNIGRIVRNVLLLAVVLAVAGGLYLWQQAEATKRRNMEQSALDELKQPLAIAVKAIAADDGAKAALGDGIESSGSLMREGTGELDRSNTRFTFAVAGSKGKGTASATALEKDGAWQIAEPIKLTVNGKSLDVKPGEAGPPEINFDAAP